MHITNKHERVIEAVRKGLEGDDAVGFVRESGYAVTSRGIARLLHAMGGRKYIQQLIDDGLTNFEILAQVFPEEDFSQISPPEPEQQLLFSGIEEGDETIEPESLDSPLYDIRKISIKVPADLFEAIRLAAKAENKSQNNLIVEILTAALSQLPRQVPE